MKNLMLALLVTVMAVATSLAQSQTVTGTLIDNMCLKPGSSRAEAAEHTRECALMPDCIESGYAVVAADGTAYKLDEKGNTDVVAALKASSKASNLTVSVTGTIKDGTIAVSSITLDD